MLKTLIFDRKCRIGCYCLGSCGAGGALYGKNITFVLSIVVYMLYYAFLCPDPHTNGARGVIRGGGLIWRREGRHAPLNTPPQFL